MRIDLTYARLIHLKWASQLYRLFRNYGEGITLHPEHECDVGVWIRSIGLKDFGFIEEIPLLDSAHSAFHKAAARTIECLKKRHFTQAEEAYTEVNTLSREIIYLLTIIEYRLDELKKLQSFAPA